MDLARMPIGHGISLPYTSAAHDTCNLEFSRQIMRRSFDIANGA